jgi:two-component system cell cycle sensor histidine kinase/response regulator CckA
MFVFGKVFDNIHFVWQLFFAIAAISVVGFFSFITYRILFVTKNVARRTEVSRALLSVLAELDEIIILDNKMNIAYAKHLPINEFSFDEVIRSQFIDADGKLNACHNAIKNGTYFEDVLQAVKTNEFDENIYIRLRVLPLYTNSAAMAKYRAIILSNVTLYKATQQEKLSNVLDQYFSNAPFSLICVNSRGEILDLSGNLKFLDNRDKIVGSHISIILDIAPDQNITGLKKITKVKLRQNRSDEKYVFISIIDVKNDLYILTLFEKKELEESFDEDAFLKAIPIPSILIEKNGKVQLVNLAAKTLFKHEVNVGSFLNGYIEDYALLEKKIENNDPDLFTKPLELKFDRLNLSLLAYVNQWNGGNNILLQFIDTSEQKKLEQQFIQAQKTQAVGQLAGGIAHDFNNLLTAIIGFCDLLLQRVMPNDPSFTDLMQIKQNANRATNLVKQLLAFSRRQTLQPRRISVVEVLSDLSALLRRLIGSQIRFRVTIAKDLWPVKVDTGQFEQVIINLTVNACDAMPDGGDLTIESTNYVNAFPKTIGDEILPAGEYVLISVTDTGCGIPHDLLKTIFEPFFSTKDSGKGTGLGLATAHGIIKQTGGAIEVESQVEKGTTFKVFLPRCDDKEEEEFSEKKEINDITGTESVLLVEDEDAVRIFASRALREKGYRVLEAANGRIALKLISEGARPNVLVTDVAMPEMDGKTLSMKIREIMPTIPTIFMSGYAEEAFRQDLVNDKSIHFISKPFTLRDLASKVRKVLSSVEE